MSQLFQSVAGQFQSASQYQKFIKECEKQFDIKVYRLASFTVPYARKIYLELDQKYRQKALEPNPSGWYQNQRRLFVWFVLCYMHYKVLDHSKFVDSYDKNWGKLSDIFWHKEVYFLKYQLLNICKAKGRTVWRAREDELLRKVFRNFKLGEWNEIAKEFYRDSAGEFFKTPKQCRERWQNHLNQGIRKGDWSREEDLAIFQFIAKNQRKNWAQIVKSLNETRTEHMIKNRYKSLTTKMMAERDVTEMQAAQIILGNLQGAEKAKNEQDFQIQEVSSQYIIEGDGVKQQLLKTPKREPEPNHSKISLRQGDSNWLKDGRDFGIPFQNSFLKSYSNNQFNFNPSQSSYMIFNKSSMILKPFPLPEMSREDERKNNIFDPSESLKSNNSAKNADSMIFKII